MTDTRPFFSRLREDTAGNTLAIAAAALIPLTAMAGGALDLSIAYMARAKLQNACDAAVLAGRQSMTGSTWTSANQDEADKFFDFNFPAGTHDAQNLDFDIQQNPDNATELLGAASASIPTVLMRIFGKQSIDIEVTCDALRDQGDNDVVLVLDVTGSMNEYPSSGGWDKKIDRLRDGAVGLYRALDGDANSVTRFGIVPYAMSVNVARQLKNKDILRTQPYVDVLVYEKEVCNRRNCRWVAQDKDYVPQDGDNYRVKSWGSKNVKINASSWNKGNGDGDEGGNTQKFRESGNGCIEERPSFGEYWSAVKYYDYVSSDDVDTLAGNAGNETELQFGRYDPGVQEGSVSNSCPSEATKLQVYDDEDDYEDAIDAATARVGGNTYHDIGMLWGLRFISRTGFFADENPEFRDQTPVNQHIIFMTDGDLKTSTSVYSSYGIERYQNRIDDEFSSSNTIHQSRMESICSLAKSRGITVWVIVLDNNAAADEVRPCATSEAHYYFTDGSDLEEVFEKIGQGIGRLRLTQ